MNQQHNIAIAKKFLEGSAVARIRPRSPPCSSRIWYSRSRAMMGSALVGRKTGRPGGRRFIRDIRTLTEPVTFEVEDILASESRARYRGAPDPDQGDRKIIATQFAIVLTIRGDVVTRYQMLEDSFDVSKAAHT